MKKFEVGKTYEGSDLRKYKVEKRTEKTITISLAGYGRKSFKIFTNHDGDEVINSRLISCYEIQVKAL
ncbi:hypothetical protein FACS189492_3110 [Clostridia bacterium]|nr:hypothetical protein FACS189492_3110 [Clostridia bacterium]